jgi:PAS domain S-box-containing protein
MVSPASRPRSEDLARAAAVGILVCAGYYLGARVGFALTLRPLPVSTLWPPNALLLAALLLTPTRWWWAMLLAVLPAHVFVQLGTGIPMPMVLSWYVSNSAEALIGAGGVRLLHPARLRLDSFRQVAVFLLAAGLIAPLLSSFLDAGLVTLNQFGQNDYWQVFSTRLPSNIVAALTVATVVVTVGSAGLGALRPASRGRLLEATLLIVGLLGTCLAVFATFQPRPRNIPALIYAPLPFLLWAAVRFGPVGISTSLLACTLVAIWGATRGLGPFVTSSLQANAVSIQLFIIISAVPLLTLAAVIQERGRAERRARRNAERLSLALRAARMGAWHWDAAARSGSLSRRARSILGIADRAPALTAPRLLRAVHPEDRHVVAAALRQPVKSGGLYEVEFRLPHHGEVRWIRASALALSEGAGRRSRVLGVATDITARKRVLDAVEESERRFRGVFEMGIVPMAFWQADGAITDANDAYLRLTGFTREEMEAGELRWDRLTAPEHRDADTRARRQLFERGDCAPFEKEYLLRDGRRVAVQVGIDLLGQDHGISVEMDLTARKRAEREIEARLRFERLVSDLSAAFATTRGTRAEDQIPTWLARLGELLDAHWVRVMRLSPDRTGLRLAYSWTAPGHAALPEALCTRGFPDLGARLMEGRTVAVENCREPPPGVDIDAAEIDGLGTRALLSFPLGSSGKLLGALTLLSDRPRAWPQELVHRLRVVADIFGYVLAREALEAGRRQAEAVNSAILASLPGMMAILDRNGCVVRVNDAWARTGDRPRTVLDGVGPDGDMLEICRRAGERGDSIATQVLRGLEAVLSGTRRDFALSYSVSADEGETQWYEMQIQRLSRREGGAVVTRLDCTARKRAEMESAINRAELAHVVRVATMGELTASLAHELSQPLTAIRSNAQAGSRLLATGREPEEIGEIFSDIITNDRRASEIVTRIRNLVRKGELELTSVDLNGLVREVWRLVETDIILRGASTVLDLAADLPVVRGDRIQLQQVVLNLVLNGLEAMEPGERSERRLMIRTARSGPGAVQVAVRDTGVGIASDRLERIFDPFYTSKPDGLGMGLSIARSIVRAHGGRIWAENSPDGGACVGFDLPVEQSPR